jgi:hypothetical protein
VFEEEASSWDGKLNAVNNIFDIWFNVQRKWVYLDGIFSGSADIKHLLPTETSKFASYVSLNRDSMIACLLFFFFFFLYLLRKPCLFSLFLSVRANVDFLLSHTYSFLTVFFSQSEPGVHGPDEASGQVAPGDDRHRHPERAEVP